jgi:membrane-bound lytic murein transglycosylase D
MFETKRCYNIYIILFSVVLLFPLIGCAQSTSEMRGVTLAAADVSAKVVKNQPSFIHHEGNDYNQEDKYSEIRSGDRSVNGSTENEDKQEMMEKALELLEDSDKLWGKGDLEGTLDTLDEAYSLILDTNGDVTVAQEKDDLRLLIARRILAVYSSKQRKVSGKNSEIPLIINDDVEKEIRSFQGWERENFIAAYQRSGLYRDTIIKELKKAGIPQELFWLPLVESFFKVNAYSRARALGLWQFIPSTGYKFGLNRDEWIDERMDVLKSTRAAIAYLKELHNMFGDWLTVLAAYNCGEGRVLRVISRQHINYLDSFWDLYRHLPNETARYVPRFLATLHIINNPKKYGFDLNVMEKPIEGSTVQVNKIMRLKDIADKMEISEEILYILNSELRHKMTPDREYALRLPDGTIDKFNLLIDDISQIEKPLFVSIENSYKTGKAFIKHQVRKGETVYSIAKKYNVSVSSIRSHNRLNPNTKLAQGRRLTIPIVKKEFTDRTSNVSSSRLTSSGKYRVEKGDTLSNISRRFSIPVSQLKKINNLKTENIQAGQQLIISKTADNRQQCSGSRGVPKNKKVKKIADKESINKKVLSAHDLGELGTNKYIVTKNDSLNSIAKKNNINVSKLMELNKLSANEKLVPGQILIVK